MGNDAPLACLSNYNPLIYDYFKQLFAQGLHNLTNKKIKILYIYIDFNSNESTH